MGGISVFGSGETASGGGGFDQMCFPVGKRTQNKSCCQLYGGPSCGTLAVPANPAPPSTSTQGNDANLVFTQSAYGGVIPIVFGSDLINGNVIWATPFVKHTYTDGTSQKFYYTVSLAIAVCEGTIDHLLRLYVADQLVLDNTTEVNEDGTPVRGADGVISSLNVDLISPESPLVAIAPTDRKTRITIFDGGPNQTPPQAMVDQEDYDFTPAYRGTAFLLIENFLVADSVPSLAIEVSANTESLFPRLTGAYTNNVTLATANETGIAYIPGYNVYLLGGKPTGTSGNNTGLVLIDGNTLEVEKESIFANSTTDSGLIAPDYVRVLTSGNVLLVTGITGGGIGYGTYSPFYDQIIDVSGFAGSGGTHGSAGPASSFDGIIITRGTDMNGDACDVVLCPSFPFTGQPTVAFMTISDIGEITYTFHGSQTSLRGMTSLWGGTIQGAPYTVPQQVANDKLYFDDGAPTLGTHVYYFGTVPGNDQNIYVDRIDFDVQGDGSVSVSNPRLVNTDIIPATDLFGTKAGISRVFQCASDHTIIVAGTIIGAQDQVDCFVFKYDPLNARIVWKTGVVGTRFAQESDYMDLGTVDDVSNDKWMWVDVFTQDIWAIDLTSGVAGKVLHMPDQDLAPPVTGASGAGMYNGREDAFITWGTNSTNIVQKIFLSRTNRAQVPLSTIITKLLNRVDWRTADIGIQGFDSLAVDGYTISSAGYTLRQAFNELQQVFTYDIVESNGEIIYKQRGNTSLTTIQETKLQSGDDTGSSPWLQETHEYDLAGTRKISVTYRDIDREYKSNVQSVQLPKYDNATVDEDAAIQVQVPIVLNADQAKKLAEILLYAKITYQTGYSGALPYQYMQYDPSDVVTFQFNPDDGLDDITMRLRQTTIGADHVVQFSGVREDPDIYVDQVALFGTLGRYVPQQIPQPPTRVEFTPLQIPFYSETLGKANDGLPTTYPVYMTLTTLSAAAKPPTDNITITTDSGTSYDVAPFVDFPTWGFVTTALPAHPEYYTTDFASTLRVRIMSTSGATLGSCSDYFDMMAGTNKCLAVVGNEVVQFQTATDLGNNIWEFTVLRRALFGTEIASQSHVNGERFVLIYGADGLFDSRGLRQTNIEIGDGPAKLLTIGMPTPSNPQQPDLTTNYYCSEFKPFMPSAGQINYVGSDAVVSWQRRSRYDGEWTDDGSEAGDAAFTDASADILVPTFDLYLTKTPLTFNPNLATTYMRKVTVSNTNTFTYTSAMQTADSFVNTTDTLAAVVVQTVDKKGLGNSDGLLFSRGPLG